MRQLRQGNSNNNSPEQFKGDLKTLLIEEIEEIQNVRTQYPEDTIKELADSIERHGLLHPIVVIKHRTDEETERTIYKVIAGHRRLRAYRFLHSQDKPTYREIKAIVRTSIGDIETNQLIENIHREDLNPADLEKAIKSIMDREGLNQIQLAERIGKNEVWISKMLTAEYVRESFVDETISKISGQEGHIKNGAESFVDETQGATIENIPSSVIYEFSKIKDKKIRNETIKNTLKDGHITQKKAREKTNKVLGKTPSVKPSQTAQESPYRGENEKRGIGSGTEKTDQQAVLNAVFDIVEILDENGLIKYVSLTTRESLKHLKGTDREIAIKEIKKIIKQYDK